MISWFVENCVTRGSVTHYPVYKNELQNIHLLPSCDIYMWKRTGWPLLQKTTKYNCCCWEVIWIFFTLSWWRTTIHGTSRHLVTYWINSRSTGKRHEYWILNNCTSSYCIQKYKFDNQTFCDFPLWKIKQKNWTEQHLLKALLNSFHFNGHTLGFHSQTQKFEPPGTA